MLQRIVILICLGLALLLGGIFSLSCCETIEQVTPIKIPAPAPAVGPNNELAASVEQGKALFNDNTLGKSGMSCNSCHIEGGTKDNPQEMMGMKMDAFDNLGTRYPQYVPMVGKVITLAGMVNFCIVNPLKGEALSWDDQKLIDLTAYCASVRKAE